MSALSRRVASAPALLLMGILGQTPNALGHEIVPPKPLSQPAPGWPEGIPCATQVLVPVLITVDANGTIRDAEVEASAGSGFDRAAVEAVQRWSFLPATAAGQAVSARVRAIVRFSPGVRGTAAPGSPRVSPAALRPSGAGPAQPIQAAPRGAAALPSETGPSRPMAEPRAAAGALADVEIRGERVSPPRSASETSRQQELIRAAPHRTGGDVLQILPGVFITQHSGQGKAYQIFYRGFDAVHGQDLEFWVGGAPANDVSNIHGQGYADLHFVMPEVVSRISVMPGNYSPEQGDFAVAGTVRYDLGYREPGITTKGTLGSFGEKRVFLAYHGRDSDPGSFAAFEAQKADGFGPARASQRASVVAQHVFRVGDGRVRLQASGYAGSFASPGAIRLLDVERGLVERNATYGVNQGGFSSRYQWVAEYQGANEHSHWSIAPYVVLRGLKLKQNYTGFLLNETDGDSAQLMNDASTLGVKAQYRRAVTGLPPGNTVEAGVSARQDWIRQSQLDVGSNNQRVLGTVVDAQIRALDAAGWLDIAVVPMPRVKIRAGLRVDGLAYLVQDNTPSTEARVGADPDAFARKLRPPSPGGQARSAQGTHYGPRITVEGVIARGLRGVASYGEGFRSPQARSLGDGEKTPFTKVRSLEAGFRYVSPGLSGSVAAFHSALNNDLVFDAATTRNERAPASVRTGGALEYLIQPTRWFVSSGSATYTRATFTESDAHYLKGDKLPYVPELILRQDLAITPELGQLGQRSVTGRLGTALTGMFNRPQPYGAFGHDVVLVDLLAELRLREVALGIDIFNLLGAGWYDSEYTFSANWNPGGASRLVPERYVTVGAPRTVLATLSLFID